LPDIQKRFPSTKPPKPKGRGRTYVLIGIILAIIAVGVAVYVSQVSNTSNPGDFDLSAPSGITLLTNTTTTSLISITFKNGFSGTVRLTASAPKNVTATISPVNVTGTGTSALSLVATFPGNYSVTITGTSGSLRHTATPIVATPVFATLSVTNGTTSGVIEVELFRAQTPKTVANFVNLAQTGFYNNLVWHRIASPATNPGNPSVIQTGDPNTRYGNTSLSTWGTGGSSQTVPLEIDNSLHNTAGTLGMARGQALNSATSQFYINYADNTNLDGSYAVFGKVIKDDMNMVHSISIHPVDSSDRPLAPYPFLVTVTISYSP
jgi:cyclophilin family peptidyl-prolyl cis-trans isomerase